MLLCGHDCDGYVYNRCPRMKTDINNQFRTAFELNLLSDKKENENSFCPRLINFN